MQHETVIVLDFGGQCFFSAFFHPYFLITPIKNITSYSSMSTSKLSCRFCLVNRPPLSSGKRNHYLDKLDILCILFPFMVLIFIAPCTIIV